MGVQHDRHVSDARKAATMWAREGYARWAGIAARREGVTDCPFTGAKEGDLAALWREWRDKTVTVDHQKQQGKPWSPKSGATSAHYSAREG